MFARRVAHIILGLLVPATVVAQSADTGRVTVAPGVSLYYEKYGSGPEMVVVPNRLFMPEFRDLRRPERTLVLYDQRNRGKSGRVEDTTHLTILADVEDLEALRRHFGAERMSVLGYSYLGLMVALYATMHPERVERLVQIGPVPRTFGTAYPPDQVAGRATLDSAALAAAASWRAARDAAGSQGDGTLLCRAQHRYLSFLLVGRPENRGKIPDVCVYDNEGYYNQIRHLNAHFGDLQKRTFPKESFTRLAIPILTVHGTLDRNAPYGAGLEWAATFENGRLITVVGGAHQVWLDDPAVLLDIDRFLSGEWPASARGFGRR